MTDRVPGPENADTFFERFVHPWLAAATAAGLAVWVISFLVAAVGLVGRNTTLDLPATELFFVSGLIGLGGVVILSGCTVVFLLFLARRELGI